MDSQTICFALFITISLFAFSKCDRKVTSTLNPGCSPSVCKKDEVILVHVRAEGAQDTLHHLWDFTGKPALMIALTDNNASLKVSWQSFQVGAENAVNFDPPPKYVYGTVFDKLIEFNDEMNAGDLKVNNSNSSYVTLWDTKDFDWRFVSLLGNSSGDATLTVEASNYLVNPATKKDLNGTVRFVMSAFGGEAHGEALPHLLHSGNASQVDVSLDHVSTKYKSSRFGLQLITVSSELPGNSSVTITSRKTMDDEHAPGIFTIVEMVSPAVQEGGCGGYLQWRPVVYQSPAREMTSSTETVQYSPVPVQEPRRALAQTLLYSALSDQLSAMLVTATNVTFGTANDGYYTKTNYAAWTMLAGYGHPPEEQFSMLVTLVLLIGLGLPALLILIGTGCIILRRLQRNKDDLFLSR